jgi:cell division protein FtsL
MDRQKNWLVVVSWLGVVSSALTVVYVSHGCRTLYAELAILEQHANELQVEWGQLLLEQSYLASYARIEQLATEQLQMRAPRPSEIVVVSQ